MSRARLACLVALALSGLACSGLKEGFNQGFDSSFRQSFIDSCSEGRAGDTEVRALCECAADSLLAKYSATDLMKMSTSDEAALAAEVEPIMTQCARGGGAPAAPAPAAPTP